MAWTDHGLRFLCFMNNVVRLQILMNACPLMLVEPILSVITPSDHTDVNVQLDLLLTAVHRTH